MYNVYVVCLLTACLTLSFATAREWYHSLLPCTIEHEVHLNAVSHVSEYGKMLAYFLYSEK
jgi:hypothetical protein